MNECNLLLTWYGWKLFICTSTYSPKKALCYLCLMSLSTIFQLYCIAKFLEQETWVPGENYWRVTQTFIIFKLYQAHLVRGCIKHTLPGAASSTHSQGLYQAHPSRGCMKYTLPEAYQVHLARGCIKYTLPVAASSTHSQGLYQAHPSRGCMKYTLPEAYQVHLARGCIKYTLPGAVSSTSYQRLYQAHLTMGCIKYTMLWPWIKLTNLNGDRLWLYR